MSKCRLRRHQHLTDAELTIRCQDARDAAHGAPKSGAEFGHNDVFSRQSALFFELADELRHRTQPATYNYDAAPTDPAHGGKMTAEQATERIAELEQAIHMAIGALETHYGGLPKSEYPGPPDAIVRNLRFALRIGP